MRRQAARDAHPGEHTIPCPCLRNLLKHMLLVCVRLGGGPCHHVHTKMATKPFSFHAAGYGRREGCGGRPRLPAQPLLESGGTLAAAACERLTFMFPLHALVILPAIPSASTSSLSHTSAATIDLLSGLARSSSEKTVGNAECAQISI